MKRARSTPRTANDLFPLFLKIEGRRTVVVGASRIAEGKISGLLRCGAEVHVVAPRATRRVRGWARRGLLHWHRGRFQARHLREAFLVVVATGSLAVQEAVYRQARRAGILCNSVDDPVRCDFYYPAVVRRGSLQIAISTAGLSPSLAQRLRKQFEREFGPEYAEWLARLGELREQLFVERMSPERRRRLLHRVAGARAFSAFLRRAGR